MLLSWRSDFDGRVDVVPVSNPNVFSQAQRIALAQTKLQLAAQAPEIHNMHEVYRDMYEALGVNDVDRLMQAVTGRRAAAYGPCSREHKCFGSDAFACVYGSGSSGAYCVSLGIWF